MQPIGPVAIFAEQTCLIQHKFAHFLFVIEVGLPVEDSNDKSATLLADHPDCCKISLKSVIVVYCLIRAKNFNSL